MTPILPVPNVTRRAILFGILTVLIVFVSGSSWWLKLFGLAMGALFLGSFRRAWIDQGVLYRQFTGLFVPQPVKSWPLAQCQSIEKRWQTASDMGWNMFFGADNWLISKLVDWIMPWCFGQMKLRLRLENGRKVLVWQGNDEAILAANLEVLTQATGRPVTIVTR